MNKQLKGKPLYKCSYCGDLVREIVHLGMCKDCVRVEQPE